MLGMFVEKTFLVSVILLQGMLTSVALLPPSLWAARISLMPPRAGEGTWDDHQWSQLLMARAVHNSRLKRELKSSPVQGLVLVAAILSRTLLSHKHLASF